MKNPPNWKHILYVIGVIAFALGALDPLEGSVVVVIGSVLIALSAFLIGDRHRKLFFWACVAILFGVFFLFYFSSKGGFGGGSSLSWWWGLLIIPYPVAWLGVVTLLIVRTIRKKAS
ncbi:MAG: hypothetical protein PSX36_08145 [bacterium]|nr:hypothetical protein [bacterium]